MSERDHAHQLIDRLPESQLSALVGLLETMIDPVAIAGAPLGESPSSEEEERAVGEAKQWLQENGGRGIPHEAVLADFDLSLDDFRRMGEESAQRRRG